MSNADFTSAFEAFLAAVGKYNSAQRSTLLNGFKADLQEALAAIGQPQPEPAAAAPAPTAATPVATPTAAAAAGKSQQQPAAADAGTSVTGAKPSSRVLQGPGGNSSFSLSGGDDRPQTHSGRKQYGGQQNSSIQFGASDEGKTSVKVHAAPGGKSSIQFGDDSAPGSQQKPAQRVDRLDDSAQHPKKPHGGRKLIHAAGGETHDVFNQKPDAAGAGAAGGVHTSVKTHAAPGGNSQISLGGGGDAKAAAAPADAAPAAEAGAAGAASSGGGDVSPALLKSIIDAVYRKGKVKDTFTKFTGNKGKVLTSAELKDGVISIGINGFTDAQADSLLARFAADKKNMSYPEFMKMMSAN